MAAVDPALAVAQQLLHFREALGRIGFDPDAQDALNQHGFNSMYNLLIYSKDQIKRVCTVLRERPVNPLNISLEQEQFLTAMRFWVKTRVRTNRTIDPQLFTRDVAVSEAIKMVNQAEEATADKESDVKLPEKFKLTSKWIVFAESLDTYLNRLKGQGRVPLNYVIRTVETPEPGTVFNTEQELMIATAPLEGDQFDIDNERVFGVIKQLTLEGPAWAYINENLNRIKDGRGAWLALRAHYEGESFLNKQKEEAYKTIDNLHYKGERTTFTFEHFTGLLTRSYNDLQRFGEPVLESKKVRDLLAKISDPKLESAKQAIRINIDYKNNFSMAINFLAESVDGADRNRVRIISGVQQGNSEQGHRGGRGFRGRGRHAGRHNHHIGGRNHGGNGRGGGRRGRGRITSGTNGGRSVSTNTYIPPSEWNAMTPEQKQAFLQTRAASRIQAITTSLNDDVSTITNATQGIAQSQAQGQQLAALQTASVGSIAGTVVTPSVTIPFGGRAAHANRNG
jgi:hypothetical protein